MDKFDAAALDLFNTLTSLKNLERWMASLYAVASVVSHSPPSFIYAHANEEQRELMALWGIQSMLWELGLHEEVGG